MKVVVTMSFTNRMKRSRLDQHEKRISQKFNECVFFIEYNSDEKFQAFQI